MKFCSHGLLTPRAQKIEAAMVQFKQMKLKGVVPNQRTYHLIIMGLVREKKANDAEAVFIAMRNVDSCTGPY
jgi:pentatricopeptide repeat protein